MKRILVLGLFVFAALLLGGNNPAEAQTVFCYQLTGFCDQIQVTKDGFAGWHGLWDANCDGVPSSIAGKGAHLITRPLYAGVISTYTWRFRFYKRDGVFDMFGTDGTTPFANLIGSGFTRVKEPCVFTINTNPNKRPSTGGLR